MRPREGSVWQPTPGRFIARKLAIGVSNGAASRQVRYLLTDCDHASPRLAPLLARGAT